MENDWVVIYNTGKLYLAQMAKEILEEEDIECILLNKQDSILLIGEIEVLVKRELVIKAKHLIKNLEY